jgi:hypothetical protein
MDDSEEDPYSQSRRPLDLPYGLDPIHMMKIERVTGLR